MEDSIKFDSTTLDEFIEFQAEWQRNYEVSTGPVFNQFPTGT